MGTVYAIANQKGGVGKTTTAVNLAACVAEAGYESLLVDIDPQSNATLGLGIDKHIRPTVYDALLGDDAAGDGDRGRPGSRTWRWCRPARIWPAPPSSCPACPAPRTGCGRRWTPIRERYAFMLLDCPPSLGPLTVNALVAADRVIVPGPGRVLRAGGPGRPAGHAVAGPARAQPPADRGRDAADHARRAHPAGPGRRARGPRALPRPWCSTP